jgi:O-antigen ligase
VAAFGLVDLYVTPIEWWRDSGAVGFFRHQGYDYHGPGGLPENFVFNSSAGVFRRLTSLFLSPLGTAYLLGVALLAAAAGGPLRRKPALLGGRCVLWTAALLLTLSRSTIAALAGAFVVLAIVLPRPWPLAAAVACVGSLFALNAAFPHVAPHTHFFPADIRYQHEQARLHGGLPKNSGLLSTGEPSFRSHLHLLRQGVTTVAHHPQGYGLGNAGVTAVRFGAPLKAGESTYTELGVEAGALGALAFVAWSLMVLIGLGRSTRRAGDETRRWGAATMTASFALVLALAIQTDVLGVLWLAFGIWWLTGSLQEPQSADHVRAGRAA